MKKELLVASICMLFLIISFSGCVEESVTAEEVKNMFLQALEEINSYKHSSDSTITATTINDTETNTTAMMHIATGEVDILNKKLKQFFDITYAGESKEEHMIVYIVDNVTYYGNRTNGNITWTISHFFRSEVWNLYSQLEQLTIYLENETEIYNNSELKILSDETFENVDCYVLQFKVTNNQSSDYSQIGGYYYVEMDVKYWISKDDNLLKKCRIASTSDSSGTYSFGDGNRFISVSEMEVLFYDYNVPLNIVVPDEAKNSSWPYPNL